jgi:hypothetical protein
MAVKFKDHSKNILSVVAVITQVYCKTFKKSSYQKFEHCAFECC